MDEREAKRLLEGRFTQPGDLDAVTRGLYDAPEGLPADPEFKQMIQSGVGPSDFEIKISALRAAIDFTRGGMPAADELIRCAALIETYLRGEKS